jgi:hypothetical protein
VVYVRQRAGIIDLLNPPEVERAFQRKRQRLTCLFELGFQNHAPYRKPGRVKKKQSNDAGYDLSGAGHGIVDM